MTAGVVGTREEWLAARLALLQEEKALNRRRDELAEQRRALPWVPVDKEYVFHGAEGERTLTDLFGEHSQLLTYHFMFGPGWGEGCPSCSFITDCIDGTGVHLAHRDVTLVCVGHAPYAELAAYRARMGWTTPFFSSSRSDFNADFHVSFTPEEQANGAEYNFTHYAHPEEELPGISAFAKGDDGRVFHTYSSYERGLDPMMSAYQLLDLTPKGRDEKGLPFPASWLRRHDAYED
ncbi:MAG TPA: thioredoxin family protein [Acidimicrobiales bacterium]|nr:thioredoxin family protein [Acidimicrobiales bacterium]